MTEGVGSRVNWRVNSVLIVMTEPPRGVILHVDDERPVLESMALLLKSDGYQVAGATSGAEALELVSAGLRPDVLILDFHLDDEMNGADLGQQLRRTLAYSPPIIMLTGYPTSAELPWITDAPIWLAQKPIGTQILLAALPGLVLLSRATRSAAAQCSALSH